MDGNYSRIVAKQYTEWAYPKPINDLEQFLADGNLYAGSPHKCLADIWPYRTSLEGLKVLIAGCGTNQGPYYAYTMPGAEITAIDLSLTSLGHSQFLKEKHNLRNLNLLNMSLLDVDDLDEKYDLIISTGVLHHLENPAAGIAKLRDVLKPDGVMRLMLYGLYPRQGVYQLQKAFKVLGCKQEVSDLETVQSILGALPQNHKVRAYIGSADDLDSPSGYVDTFLHNLDQAYTVPDVLDFVKEAGLAFWGWVDPLFYNVRSFMAMDAQTEQKLNKLPAEKQWEFSELCTDLIGKQDFFVCHPAHYDANKLDFYSDAFWRFIPSWQTGTRLIGRSDTLNVKSAKLQRRWHIFTLDAFDIALAEFVNGKNTIYQIFTHAKKKNLQINPDHAKSFFIRMRSFGHCMFGISS